MNGRTFRGSYLGGDDALRPFYRFDFPQPDWAAVLAARKSFPPANRATLSELLQEQTRRMGGSPAALANAALLRKPTTFTVTTGQQPGLAGGPLYVLYKASAVVHWCARLKTQFPEYDFVPVFWVASEDHDAAEINRFALDYHRPHRYSGKSQGAVGRTLFDRRVTKLPFSVPEVAAAYQPGHTFAEAFQRLLLALFAAQGLVVLDPDDPRLKALAAPLWENELHERPSLGAIRKQTTALQAAGFPAQLTPRPINLFWLAASHRVRIIPDGKGWRVLGGPASDTVDLADDWASISPNAALRPVYQEWLLPNLAYVGGWGELAYWFQLKATFEAFNVFFPLLLPRPGAFLIPENDWATLAQAGLSFAQFLLPDALLRKHFRAQVWDAAALTPYRHALEVALQQLEGYVNGIDPGLARSIAAEQVRLHHRLDHLCTRIANQQLAEQPEPFRSVMALKQRLQPDGYVQERHLNFQAFDTGEAPAWVNALHQRLVPDEFALQVLTV